MAIFNRETKADEERPNLKQLIEDQKSNLHQELTKILKPLGVGTLGVGSTSGDRYTRITAVLNLPSPSIFSSLWKFATVSMEFSQHVTSDKDDAFMAFVELKTKSPSEGSWGEGHILYGDHGKRLTAYLYFDPKKKAEIQ